MKVGLIRHFRVKKPFPVQMLVTADELARWFEEYDTAEIEAGQADLGGIDWKRCYTSDLPRAVGTAERIYGREIIALAGLREIPPFPFRGGLRLPFLVWAVLVRVAWLIGLPSEIESKAVVQRRIETVLDQVLQPQEDVLIVSHAALMLFLRRELLRRGFRGPSFRTAANGKLYLFER